MQTFFKKAAAVVTSAMVAFITFSLISVIGAEDTEKEIYTVHFDLSDPDISLYEDKEGNILPIEDFTAEPNSYNFLPEGKLVKSGYKFQGWTADGIYGYLPGDVVHVTDSDIEFKPLFVDSSDLDYHDLSYYVEIDGEVVDTHLELRTYPYRKNSIVKVSLTAIQNDNARQIGWQTNGYQFLPEQKIVMGSEDIVLTPIWHNYHELSYYAGDVSNVVGATYAGFTLQEGGKKELADATRFSRIGYSLKGWHCTWDDKDYPFLYTFEMPDEDVDFFAIWEPINYTIVFSTGLTDVKSVKVQGATGTVITVPELPHEKEGYKFGGYLYNGVYYMPGDEFFVEGAMPGLGINPKAVWVGENDPLPTATTTTTTVTTTTVTTTSAETTTVSSTTETTSAAATETTTVTVSDSDSKTTVTTTATTTDTDTTTPVSTTVTSSVTSSEDTDDIVFGDTNLDGDINLSDAVLIMQALANPSKYGVEGTDETHITEKGIKNADVIGNDGMTNSDALTIQQFILKVINSLPVLKEE